LLRATINHTPVPSLGNKAPVVLFCALPLPTPLEFCSGLEQRERNKNDQRGAQKANFSVGDYVLWSRVDQKAPG
ncbi:hypothetical protein PHYSODRAFT_433431, partial [Phytophthora sojae]